MKIKGLFTLLLLYAPLLSYALPFKAISTKDGLSTRRTIMCRKDNDGYLWIATRTGIDRYDGEAFTHYTLKAEEYSYTEHPRGVVCGKDGSILAFSDKDLWLYSTDTDSFGCMGISLQPNESISEVSLDFNLNIWLGTNHNLYVRKQGSSVCTPVMEDISVHSVIFENSMHGWAGTSNGIYHLTYKEDGSYRCYRDEDLAAFDDKRIQSLHYDSTTGYLWIGTFESGAYCYSQSSSGMRKLDTDNLNLPVRSISPVGSDCIWIGTDGAGIYEYNRFDCLKMRVFSQSGSTMSHIAANSIYDIMENGNSVYVCTYTGGILVHTQSRLISNYLYNVEHSDKSLDNDYVNCILEDKRKRIWLGTNNGISRYDPNSSQWKHFLNSAGNNVILSLCEDVNGNVWAGGYACDVVHIDPSDKIHTWKYTIGGQTRKQRYAYSICRDSEGTIWMGGIINGIVSYSPSTGISKRYNIRGVNQILPYGNDTLFIATNSGVLSFDKNSGKSAQLHIPGNEELLKTNVQRLCIIPDYPDMLWIGTESRGVASLELKTGKYRLYTKEDGLSSDNICGLQHDNFGRMWISTENGLNCLSLKQDYIENFYEPDGLPDKTLNLRSYCLLSNGHIMWGTPSGAFELNPEEYIWKDDVPYNLRFKEFALFNTPVRPCTEDSPLSSVIDRTEHISLRHNQNSFSFRFLNLGYQTSYKYQYSWLLEGFDKDWCTPTSHHHAVYTNIPPGNYTFRTRVMRGGRPENFSERSISISVSRPWWKTLPAFAVYLLIVAGLSYILIHAWQNRREAKDSDRRIRFFINIAHDLRTPLTLIKAPLSELSADTLTETGRAALSLARKNTEKLLNMVTQLLDFQKMEREAMSLQVEETYLYRFISGLICNFEPLAKEKEIRLEPIIGIDNEATGFIDQRKFSIIMDNLISNSIKYTMQGGCVRILCSIDSRRILSIKVSDNGIGISDADQKKLFKRFYRGENAINSKETGSGIGLLLTKKMTLLHKGTITFTSTAGEGTTFTVRIPVSQESYAAIETVNRETQPSQDAHHDTGSHKNPRLMIVEDNDDLRTYLSRYFSADYRITECHDGLKALETVRTESPDFIISDVMMPGLSGTDLCRKLKSDIETCHIPVILLTSLAERDDIIRGLDAGADDYITKPFDPPVLKSKIASIISNRILYHKKFIDRSSLPDESSIGELDRQFMAKVVDYVEENMMHETLSIDTIAMEMAMSRTVFFKKIKSLTGLSPQDLVRDIRMKKAAALLEERRCTISEIAYLTGYPNAKYFSTAFKKYYGKTPSEYSSADN